MVSITQNMVMILSNSEFITATVIRIHILFGVSLRPDGWPLSEGTDPSGFGSAVEAWIEPLDDDSLIVPGVLTDRMGKPLTPEQIQSEIANHHTENPPII